MNDWLTKKGLQELHGIFEGMYKKQRVLMILDCDDVDFLHNESIYVSLFVSAEVLSGDF